MKTRYIFFFICCAILASCSNNRENGSKVTTGNYKVPEDSAINKAVADAYKAISFKKGEQPRYDQINNYFIPLAQFLNFRNDSLDILGLPQFVEAYKGFIQSDSISSFYEEELYGRTDQFGRVAQRISTYRTYLGTMDSVAERGVNSFQLVKTIQGWRVSSIIWDIEKPGKPIPSAYLPVEK